jgi:hypothetical protein
MRIQKPCSKLREFDIVLLLDELGTELLFLPRDGCQKRMLEKFGNLEKLDKKFGKVCAAAAPHL